MVDFKKPGVTAAFAAAPVAVAGENLAAHTRRDRGLIAFAGTVNLGITVGALTFCRAELLFPLRRRHL
jgi:hypothetical protein